MVTNEIVIHEIDLAPMRLKLDTVVEEMIPETLQVSHDLRFIRLFLTYIGKVHEVKLDDIFQT